MTALLAGGSVWLRLQSCQPCRKAVLLNMLSVLTLSAPAV